MFSGAVAVPMVPLSAARMRLKAAMLVPVPPVIEPPARSPACPLAITGALPLALGSVILPVVAIMIEDAADAPPLGPLALFRTRLPVSSRVMLNPNRLAAPIALAELVREMSAPFELAVRE